MAALFIDERMIAFTLLVASIASQALGVEPPEPHGATPSPRQLAWHDHEFYAFVHFNMNTFTGVEWGDGRESPAAFNPTNLDCDQWCALFKECGLTGVILTAKHHDGFCLWDSAYTEHDVASSPWRGGDGDLVKELAAACRRHGLWMGVYISPWDRNNPIYGRDDSAYNDYFVGQLEELLSNYGEITEVWWDGANGDRGNPDKHQEYDWPRYVETVRRLQPNAVIFAPPYVPCDIRWVGNEIGVAAETQWCTYPSYSEEKPALLNTGVEGASQWMPAETDVSIRPGWYWTAESNARVKSVRKLLDIYYKSVGRNTNLLLNFPVDNRGLVHDADASALRGLASVLRETFATDIADGASVTATDVRGDSMRFDPSNVVDGDPATYWAGNDATRSASITLQFDSPRLIDRVVLQEHVELGQRVRGWTLFAEAEGEWRSVATGTTIGHKRIACLDPVQASAIRLTINDSRASPVIEAISAYLSPASVRIGPPEEAFVDRTLVTLEADRPGVEVRYTTDGSMPNERSPIYSEPISVVDNTTIRAAASDDGRLSPLVTTKSLRIFRSAEFRKPAENAGAAIAGLRFEGFEGGWQTLDQMEGREPVVSGVAPSFDITRRTRDDNAAVRFSGLIEVPADGLYRFRLTSDDGSRLWIGDELIIDHDGLHGMSPKIGTVGLEAGRHPVRVEWFNVGPDLGLRVEWSHDGGSWEEIPPARLSHLPDDRVSLRTIEYEGWEDAIEISNRRVRVVVVPAIGRVMHYSEFDGDNLLYEDPALAGVTLDGEGPFRSDGKPAWATFGGDRLWPTEERLFASVNGAKRPPDWDIDGLPWTAKPVEGGVAIESRVSRFCGARAKREITLAGGLSVVTIEQSLAKVRSSEPADLRPLPMTLWSISKVRNPTAMLFPVQRVSTFDAGVWVPHWDDAVNHAAENLTAYGGLAVLSAPSPEEHQKAGSDAPGWVAAVLGDRVVGHFFRFDPHATYPDGGTSVTVYQNDAFGELECLSPLARLEPGESIEHVVCWDTKRLAALTDTERVAEAAAWAAERHAQLLERELR